MAGYSRFYVVGGLGGFQGADGVNPITFQILVRDQPGQRLEAHYFDSSIRPLGKIRTIVPAGPDTPEALIDACIVFYPGHFKACPSLAKVREKLKNAKGLEHINILHLRCSDEKSPGCPAA